MKTFKNLKNSIILLGIFLLCAGFSSGILRPANALEQRVESVFQVLTGPEVHLGNWGFNLAGSLVLNAPLKLACGGEKDMDSIFIEKIPCITEDEMNNMYSYIESGRMPGGLFALSAFTLDRVVSEPTVPTNLAMFINDVKGNTIFNTNAYAAPAVGFSQPSDFFQASTLSVWKASRNIALAMLGLFLAIAALGVLFRQKLNPQAVVTIYSILPSVPLAIIFIVLSYPIVAVAMNLTWPLFSLAVKMGQDIFVEITKNVGMISPGGLFTPLTAVAMVSGAILVNPVAVAISIPIILILISLLILLIVAIIKVIYEFTKWYGTFVVLTIGFPVAAVVSILPGKQSVLMFFIKKLVVNMLVFPVGVFLLWVGLGFMATIFDSGLGFGVGGAAYVLFFGVFVMIVKFFIGFGIIWNGFKTRGILENALGVGSPIMSVFQGGGQEKPRR